MVGSLPLWAGCPSLALVASIIVPVDDGQLPLQYEHSPRLSEERRSFFGVKDEKEHEVID